VKIAMTEHITVRSFRRFIEESLPAALAAVAPLTDYRVEETRPGVGRVTMSLAKGAQQIELVYDGLPFPREDGSFPCGDVERAVVLTASSNNLEQAEIRAVGEQLMDMIGPRLVAPPSESEWDEAVLRAWFPLDHWLREFLNGAETAQWLDSPIVSGTNLLARFIHLRRIYVRGPDVSFHPSHIGRVCPFDTPEGPNCGRVLTLAVGADVRDGRIVLSADEEETALGPAASLVPLLCHNDATRQLIGGNMMRQWIPQGGPELPPKRPGNEAEDGSLYFQAFGRNAMTEYIHWLRGAGTMPQWIPQAEPELPLVRSGNEPEDGSFSHGRNFLTAYVHWKGMTYEDAIVVSESAAARLALPGPLQVGDKLSNRHGTKGVVGAILPDDEMPHLPDGRAVELVFDPMGVYSRLNFGQMIEAALGLVAQKRGEPVIAPPFRRTTPEELHALLREAGLPESAQFTLRDGKDGPELDEPSTVGIVYWGKLVHLSQAKIHHFLSTGRARPYILSGRNEYLALRTVGAYENLRDAYLTRSPLDDENDQLPARVAQGFLVQPPAPPSAAFGRLQRQLRTAMIDLVWRGDKVTALWAAPDEGDLALAEPVPHPWWPQPPRLALQAPSAGLGTGVLGTAVRVDARTPKRPWRLGRALTHIRLPERDPEVYAFNSTRLSVTEIGQRVIAANERLAQALRARAPEAVQAAAKAVLQREIATLFENLLEPHDLAFYTRAQFTGRTVLVPGYGLKLGQVGLAADMAWALFGPLVVGKVGADAVAAQDQKARRAVEKLMADSVVIINRAPTWEPTCITAFTPVMTSDLCLHMHPLCTRMFNADFDGDQAAVWLPLSEPAQREAKEKLTVLGHLKRDPTVLVQHLAPSQAVLGGLAYACESLEGRKAFEATWPDGVTPPDTPLTHAKLVARLLDLFEAQGPEAVLELLDKLYVLGIEWATRSGASFSPFVGEALKLPPAPASEYSASWDAYRSILDAEIEFQADSDPTLRAPMRAVRCGARGSTAAIRATVGPWTVAGPYTVDPPIKHGFRDGMTAQEMWVHAGRSRAALLEVHRTQEDMAVKSRLAGAPASAGFLRRAMESENPGFIFAEAAAANETDPLTDPDVRLWVGLAPT
jgi:hypothetical protein